jgi:POT family proton-dependent oligopeptide transporter
LKEIEFLLFTSLDFLSYFFWAAFEQAGSSLTFIAANQTDRTFMFGWQMPAQWNSSFNGIFVFGFALPFSIYGIN